MASPVAYRDKYQTATSNMLKSDPTADTKNGTYAGTYLSEFDQDIFLGMRFAQPPLGSLRFVSPQSVNESFSEVKDAKEYFPSCMNLGDFEGGDNWGLEQSEDCLGINVIRPAITTKSLPVLIYIHGGGFYEGSGSVDAYNLSYIVQESVRMGKPMIGVSFNYRLSGFGFLGGEEVVNKGYTNVGLRDQLMAIEWVQENINAFGGDPHHIVLWGESAGAISIGVQLGSGRLNSSHIKGAIMDSGFANSVTMGISTSDVFTEGYNNITAYLGCEKAEDTFVCLQNYENATHLINAFNPNFGVIRDNVFNRISMDYDYVPTYPSKMFLSDNFTQVPIVIGTNSDEGTLFTDINVENENIKEYLAEEYAHLSESQIDTILDLYKENDPEFQSPYQPPFPVSFEGYGLGFRRTASIVGDVMFISQKRHAAENWVSKNLTVYTYRWNLFLNGTAEQLGGAHAQELRWNFDNDQTNFMSLHPQQQNLTLTSLFNRDGLYRNHQGEAVKMAEVISKQWVSFITSLDPNKHDIYGIPNWPSYGDQYEPKKNYVYDWRGISTEIDDFRDEALKYITSIDNDLFIAY